MGLFSFWWCKSKTIFIIKKLFAEKNAFCPAFNVSLAFISGQNFVFLHK